jgi:hypothetical protein
MGWDEAAFRISALLAAQSIGDALTDFKTLDILANRFNNTGCFAAKDKWQRVGMCTTRSFPCMNFTEIDANCGLFKSNFAESRITDLGVFKFENFGSAVLAQENRR